MTLLLPKLEHMTDTNPSPDSGAEARIVVTTPEDVTNKAIESEAAQANALDLDATPSEEPEEPSDPSTEEPGEEPDDKKGKPPKGVQKRLDELTREKYDQQRRAEAAEARLQQAMSMLERGNVPDPQPQTFDPSGPPNPLNYPEGELDVNFIRDVAKYEVRQEIQAARQEAEHQKTVVAIESREDAARARYADYNEIVNPQNLGPLLQNQDVFRTLAAHENGPDLAYYLGKNPSEVMSIAQMTPYNAAMRIGQLLASITPDAPSTKTASKAPPPISPIRGSGAAPAVNYEQRMQEAEDSGNFDLWRKLKTARDSGK